MDPKIKKILMLVAAAVILFMIIKNITKPSTSVTTTTTKVYRGGRYNNPGNSYTKANRVDRRI